MTKIFIYSTRIHDKDDLSEFPNKARREIIGSRLLGSYHYNEELDYLDVEYSRTSIIQPSIIRNLDYPAWQFSCYQIRKWACLRAPLKHACALQVLPWRHACLSSAHAQTTMHGWIKAWFIYSIIIRHIHLSGLLLEPRCPDNRGSTVVRKGTSVYL